MACLTVGLDRWAAATLTGLTLGQSVTLEQTRKLLTARFRPDTEPADRAAPRVLLAENFGFDSPEIDRLTVPAIVEGTCTVNT
jgi:hypothetical protein